MAGDLQMMVLLQKKKRIQLEWWGHSTPSNFLHSQAVGTQKLWAQAIMPTSHLVKISVSNIFKTCGIIISVSRHSINLTENYALNSARPDQSFTYLDENSEKYYKGGSCNHKTLLGEKIRVKQDHQGKRNGTS